MWFIIFLVLPHATSAQHSPLFNSLEFKVLTQQHGLSINNVNAIMQDSRGFLWIATENGLNRYDGYEFKIYKNIPQDQSSLSHNEVVTIYEDNSGFIWVGTEGGGLNRFDPETEHFVRLFNNNIKEINWDSLSDDDEIPLDETPLLIGNEVNGKESDKISHNVVHALAQDDIGNLWIGTEGGGLNVFNQQTGKFRQYVSNGDNSSLCDNEIKTLIIDSHQIVWVGTENGLTSYNPKMQSFTCYRYKEGDPTSLSHNEISNIIEDKLGNLWVGTEEGGLNYFDRDKKKFTHFQNDSSNLHSISSDSIEGLLLDHQNRLWIATENGLNLFKQDQQIFYRYNYQPNINAGLSSNKLSTLFLDDANNLWIGTKNAGLNHVNLKANKFPATLLNLTQGSEWYGYPVNVIYQDSHDSLWIGTETLGLFEQQANGTIHHYNSTDKQLGLNNNDISAISEDNKGNLWIGTDDSGLYKFTRKNQTFESIELTTTKKSISAMHLGVSKNLWISAGIGVLASITPNTEAIQYHQISMINDNGTMFGDISNILELDDGTLWIGTKDVGLIHYQPKTGERSFFHNNPNNPNSLSSNIVSAIVTDKERGIWVGTHYGLNHYDPTSGQFTLYLKEHGLPSNLINNLLIDKSNNLWLTTNHGMSRFSPKSLAFSNFGREDGLSNDYFQAGSAYINKKGELFFGGSKGIDHFQSDTVVANPFPPKVQITAFQLMNKSITPSQSDVLDLSITDTTHIDLNHEQTMFAFEFSALDFTIANKNQYAYRLIGFDKDWQFVGGRRYASYTNIPPGDYRFEVKGTNNDGLWSTQEAGINIKLFAAPWYTWWAKMIYVLVTLGIIFFIVNLKFRHERNRLAMEQKKEEALFLQECFEKEQRFTADVAHELRTPIAELRTMAEIALKWPDDQTQVRPFYQDTLDASLQMQQMVNNLLALARADLGVASINLSDVDIREELERGWKNYTDEAITKQLTLENNFIKPATIFTSAPEFRLILNNVLSNAIEYAPNATKIDVDLVDEGKDFYCLRVTNQMAVPLTEDDLNNMFNRMWRKDFARSSEKHAGLGMSLIKSYAQLLSLTVDVKLTEKQHFCICIGKIQMTSSK